MAALSESEAAPLVQVDEEVGISLESPTARNVLGWKPAVALSAIVGLLVVAACARIPFSSTEAVPGDSVLESGDDLVRLDAPSADVDAAGGGRSCKHDGARGLLGFFVCLPHGAPRVPTGELPKSQYQTEADANLVQRLLSKIENTLNSDEFLQLTDSQRQKDASDCFKVFKEWSGVQAKDVIAFEETWSEKDTELLQVLDNREDGFGPGNFTTSAFAKRLPTFKDFDGMLNHSLSIVGNGNTISGKGLGREINKAQMTARFNGLVGDKMEQVSDDVGTNIDIHVMNSHVQAATDHVIQVDLEWYTPWESWCRRYNTAGKFYIEDNNRGPIYVYRPTWRCKLADRFNDFTRGFMFWWLIGRHFDDVAMYGFGGAKHFRKDGKIFVGTAFGHLGKLGTEKMDPSEKALHFEHIVYREYAKLKEGFTVI